MISFLFPGQGSQSIGMMNGFADVAVVRDTFTQASNILGQDLWALQQADENTNLLNDTVNTQPIMLTAGVAIYRCYLQLGGQTPQAMAGHSLGEYSALVASGSLDFADAVRLVRLRATLMQQAVPQGQGAMAAILGLDDETVQKVCADVAENEVVEAVNFNSPGQIVIAGHANAVKRAITSATQAGAKRAIPLPVSVPSHCLLMKKPAEELAQALADVDIQQPKIPVWHNADVATYQDPKQIKDALVRQLYSPVLWTQTIQALVKQGTTQFVECAPGKVLAGLCKRIDKQVPCTAFTDINSIQNFIENNQ